jgi:hypothetical protein
MGDVVILVTPDTTGGRLLAASLLFAELIDGLEVKVFHTA